MKQRILFVDDEPNVLQGLQRMLRSMRKEWDMVFAAGGRDALKVMSEEAFDVIVTDLRMPEMDGVQLLARVLQEYPDTIRIVLSGQADLNLTMHSTLVAHQYLTKPCRAEILKSKIARTCALRKILANSSLKEIVSRIKTLPSMPTIYTELMRELHSSKSSVQKAGEIISRDAAMTAKILQLVNSSFFGLRDRVATPAQAVTFLGIDIIKTLVLSIQVFSAFSMEEQQREFFERLWKHHLVTGMLARTIAKYEKQSPLEIDYAFIAGLLHDMGKLVLAVNFPYRYKKVIQAAQNDAASFADIERQRFGVSHSEVGAFLIGLWGFPDAILEAVLFHHNPEASLENHFGPLTAVHVANHIREPQDALDKVGTLISKGYLKMIDMPQRLAEWVRICADIMKRGVLDAV